MAQGIHRLEDKFVMKHAEPGHFADGGGLYLQVSKWGTKSWVFKFTLKGRTRGMGLGPIVDLTNLPKVRSAIAEAREEAADLRKIVKAGRDPIEERKAAKANAREDAVASILFKDAVIKCHARKEGEFRNEKHRKDWLSSLTMYATPKIGNMDVANITTQDILRVLSQSIDEDGNTLWESRTETASRLRGRLETVLSWATVAGFRNGDNPARWAGNLKELLAKPSKLAKKEKQPALSQTDFPNWFSDLRKRDGMSARALEFATLCASRSGEVRGATWDEIDLEARIWRIPGARMKTERDHRVPLTEAAIQLLKARPRMAGSSFVFHAPRGGELSDMSLSAVMRRMHEAEVNAGRKGWVDPDRMRPAVPHGLRSVFRVWTAERGYDRDMAEMALAHNVGNEVERAYQRSDMIERRRTMMADWAAHCRGEKDADSVVPFRGSV